MHSCVVYDFEPEKHYRIIYLICIFTKNIKHAQKQTVQSFLANNAYVFLSWCIMVNKLLKEPISMVQLREIMIQILDMFMNIGSLNYWISYLVPKNVSYYKQQMAMSANGFEDSSLFMDATKLDQLLFETCSVLSRSYRWGTTMHSIT